MSSEKGGHYDMTLEGRHLLGIFVAVVVLCSIFFTLGFILGRNQAASLRTASPPTAPPPSGTKAAEPQPRDLTFYDRVEGAKPAEKLPATEPAPGPATAPLTPAPAAQAQPSAEPIYLQVAAVSQEPDARRLAAELHKLGFDAEVRPPKEDRFYRVLVGPLENDELAAAARRRLEAHGFKDIVRR
jgi:cell division protein FtsN